MTRSVSDLAPERMHRTWTAPRQHLVRMLGGWGVGLSLAVATGWWSRVACVHAELVEARDAALSLEQQLSAHRPADPAPGSSSFVADAQRSALPEDDLSALVRWHALLQEHRLSDWQGRSVPASASVSVDGANHGTEGMAGAGKSGGSQWRLEGRATYAQGVALLNALVSQFPRLVVLHVQVQVQGQGQQTPQPQLPPHLAATEQLQWRLELRWSAPVPTLAHRWPAGSLLAAKPAINPFAEDRLPLLASSGHGPGARPNRADADVNQVLPSAPLKDIRLIGIVAQGEERVALVTWSTAPSDSRPSAAHVSASPATHRLRLRQTLGVEQFQVVAIEPQAVVLQALRHRSSGQRPGGREVLAWSDAPASLPFGEGHPP